MTDDVRVYRASELGGCVKSQVAGKLEYQRLATPQKMLDVFQEGTDAEVKIGVALEENDWTLTNAQLEVNISVTPRVLLQGHIDWIGCEQAQSARIVEAKSMSDAAYNDWIHMGWDTPGLIQKYKWQLSSYMNALELPAVLVAYNRLTGDLDITEVTEPFVTLGELKARVLEIDRFVRLGELPVDCDVRIWPCPFSYLEEVSYDADNFEVEGIATSYKAALTAEKVGKDAKAKLRKLLDEATGRKSYRSERVAVTYFDKRNPRTFDEQKMRDAGINPDDLRKDETKSTQVRVTLYEEGDDIVQQADGQTEKTEE